MAWPRFVASVLGASVSDVPIKTRDMFFEFVELGLGIQTEDNTSLTLLDRGNSPLQSEVVGVDKKIKVYCDLADDANTEVLLLGYDENGNWIRTSQSGSILDGEIVAASVAGTLSTKLFSSVTGVQKEATNG